MPPGPILHVLNDNHSLLNPPATHRATKQVLAPVAALHINHRSRAKKMD